MSSTQYQRNKQTYLKYCKIYNEKQVPANFKAYCQSELGLNQQQTRALVFFLQELEAHKSKANFLAYQLKGAAGLSFKDDVYDFIYELKDAVPDFHSWFTTHRFDTQTNTGIPYSIKFYLNEEQTALLFTLLNNPNDKQVLLTDTPVDTVIRTNKPRSPRTQPGAANASSISSTSNVKYNTQPLMDYLNSSRARRAVNALAKTNGVELLPTDLIFHGTPNTDRPSSDGRILNDKKMRAQLFTGCYYIDICNSNLSIAAMDGDLAILTKVIQENCDIDDGVWKYYTNYLGVEFNDANKSAVKHGVIYPEIYGMWEENLKKAEYGESLLDEPTVKELKEYRDESLEYFEAGGERTTIFGEFLKINPESSISIQKQARTLHCKYIVAIEQYIIQKVIVEYVAPHKDFVIPKGYLGDGFYLKSSGHPSNLKRYANIVAEKIVAEAAKLGIILRCKVELVKPIEVNEPVVVAEQHIEVIYKDATPVTLDVRHTRYSYPESSKDKHPKWKSVVIEPMNIENVIAFSHSNTHSKSDDFTRT
jgi:hypothetical protein